MCVVGRRGRRLVSFTIINISKPFDEQFFLFSSFLHLQSSSSNLLPPLHPVVSSTSRLPISSWVNHVHHKHNHEVSTYRRSVALTRSCCSTIQSSLSERQLHRGERVSRQAFWARDYCNSALPDIDLSYPLGKG